MRKIIEATDALNVNKPLDIPTGEYGQYQGEPMETDYGKHPVDMTVRAKVPELKFLKVLNKKVDDLEDLNDRRERKQIPPAKTPEQLNKNMDKEKQEDAESNNAHDPEEKSLEQVKKEVFHIKPQEADEVIDHDLNKTDLMTKIFDLNADYENWFKNTKDDDKTHRIENFYNESHAFRDWAPRSIDNISPTAEALDRALKMFQRGQKIENIAKNVGIPVNRLKSLLKPLIATQPSMANKQDKYAAMAAKYGIDDEISKLRKLSGLK